MADAKTTTIPNSQPARILRFKRRKRHCKSKDIYIKKREPFFKLPYCCEVSPDYQHDWKDTGIDGWQICGYCMGYELNTDAKIVNVGPWWKSTLNSHVDDCNSGNHCYHECPDGDHRCCWCGGYRSDL
jgi:hypothetical protein